MEDRVTVQPSQSDQEHIGIAKNNSKYGKICLVETPDGERIGIAKHFPIDRPSLLNNFEPATKVKDLIRIEQPKLRYLPSTPILESDYIRDRLRRKLDNKRKKEAEAGKGKQK